MIRYKQLATIFISLLLQMSLVRSQNGWFSGSNSNYVPYYSQGGTSFATTGTIQYVPLQGPPLGSATFAIDPIQNTNQPFEQYPPNGPYTSLNSPIYSNTPTVSYQGLDQANALRSAYPNQPIIIINNGGNGDTGGNSNNGNNIGRKNDGFDFGELAAILFATHKHRGGLGGAGREPGLEAETAPPLTAPPPLTTPQEFNSGTSCSGNNKCTTITHITIVLPSSSSTVSVEQKKKKDNDKIGAKKKKAKDNEEPKKIEVDNSNEIISTDDEDEIDESEE